MRRRMPRHADTDVDVLVLSSFPPGVGGGELQRASSCSAWSVAAGAST
jgi:hypothetical protein